MKTCPECGTALEDEYQFCPEDGASLGASTLAAPHDPASTKAQPASAVVLYCPACAAEYPLTFSECPVHHTALTTHGIPSLVDAPRDREPAKTPPPVEPRARRLRLVSPDADADAQAEESETPPRPSGPSGIEAYERTLEDLARPAAVGDGDDRQESPLLSQSQPDDAQKYRGVAMAVIVALTLLALIGVYAVISNGSRKPTPSAKRGSAGSTQPQPTITVQTPQAALDYQDQAIAAAPPAVEREAATAASNEVSGDARPRLRRGAEDLPLPSQKSAESRMAAASREPAAAPAPRPAPVATQPAMMRQPAATELVLPRGTFGQVAARLTNVRASRTAGGYRYELTFHLADQAGHATQWERLAIVTRSASGATRQQQIPFYHRLGADGTMSFTVSVEMPGRAPADWQGRIICTSIGSDSSGKSYRASFGANVSPN